METETAKQIAEGLGYIVAGTTALHALLKLLFKHTNVLDEKQEGAVLDFLGALLSWFSLLNGRKR